MIDEDTKTGTFLVTEADAETAILRDVSEAQVHTLSENPDFDRYDVVEATIAPEPPMAVTWEVVEVKASRMIPIERSSERPTRQARSMAAEQTVGDLARTDRAGEGEVHVLTVPGDEAETIATDLLEDPETLARAARLGVERVELRVGDGVISVRYLP